MQITNDNIVVTEPQLSFFVQQFDIEKVKPVTIDSLVSLPRKGAKKQILCRTKDGYCYKRIESIMRCDIDRLDITGNFRHYITYDIQFQEYSVDIPCKFNGSYATVDAYALVLVK